MKKYAKISAVAAVVLALAAAGVPDAHAGGWPVAAGVVGGFTAGTIVGATLACPAPPPAYYGYSRPVYVPAPVVVRPACVYYPAVPVVYPCYVPPLRPVWYAGNPYHYYFRR